MRLVGIKVLFVLKFKFKIIKKKITKLLLRLAYFFCVPKSFSLLKAHPLIEVTKSLLERDREREKEITTFN